MTIPTPRVKKGLSKGDKKFIKINIGNTVRNTNVNLPEIVMRCSMPHLSHLIGLYFHPQNER